MSSKPAVKIAFGLVLVVSAIYLLTANGHLLGQDQELHYRMARSIAREHTFAIEPLVFGNIELAGARGRDGRFYAQYAPGLPIALAPLISLGDSLGPRMLDYVPNYQWVREDRRDV